LITDDGRGVSLSDFTICLATGGGLWASHDGGQEWVLSACDDPFRPYELDGRALAVAPDDPRVVWAAMDGERGEDILARSVDAGDSYDRVDAPVGGREIWSIAISPHDPSLMFAGMRPAGILRSTDGGASWRELPLGAAQQCSAGLTRLLSIAFSDVPGEVYAGVEIDGIYCSRDDGDTWIRSEVDGGRALLDDDEVWKEDRHADIHGVAFSLTADGGRALSVATPLGYFRTADDGRSWHATRYPVERGFDRTMFYTRCLHVKPADRSVLFVGLGGRPPGHTIRGGIQRSEDGGDTWRPVSPVVRSEIWSMSSHPELPDTLVAATLNGQVLLSTDGGEDWRLLDREFGQSRAVALAPA
jgi:photosystem II stability/assembly factor-like uncharacterized protein